MEDLKIDGKQWLRDRAEVRRKIARIKRNKLNELKDQMRSANTYKVSDRFACRLRQRVIEHATPEAPFKPTVWKADQMLEQAFDLLVSSHRPCPPLPCGSDDAFMENQEQNRIEALNMFDAVGVLWTREEHRNAPNIHAFDEQYFAGDD